MYVGQVDFADRFEHCRMDNEFESEELSFKCYEDLMIYSNITSSSIWELIMFDFLFTFKMRSAFPFKYRIKNSPPS